jgi:hypothetical protein
MENIVVKLLENNGYKKIGSVSEIGIFTYQSELLGDVIIVAPYSTGDLNAFDKSDITRSVMDQFDLACRVNPNALKDTSLIMCHKVENNLELEEVKNTTLKIEENAFGFRKYVLPYTSNSINNIIDMDGKNLLVELPKRLQEGFSAYAESTAGDDIVEYETILRIYSKLPFLNYVREDNEWNSLDSFLQEKLEAHKVIRKLTEDYEFPVAYGLTPDEEIDHLLNSDEMKDFLAVREAE